MASERIKRNVARLCEIVAGAYFVIGAIPKAMDINRFSVQMSAYQVITDKALLPWFALATLFAEIALGVALLVGLRLRGVTVLALQAMLLVFTGLIVYAWAFHGLEDCGCFPLLKMSPPVSIAKNVVLFAMGLFVWHALIRSPRLEARQESDPLLRGRFGGGWPGIAARFSVSLLAAVAAVAYAAPRVERIAQVSANPQEKGGDTAGIDYAQFVFTTDMGSFDLGKGVHLVPILSMTCEDCMGKVPLLNDLMAQPGMPPMVALCYEDKAGDLDNFRGQTQPMFPLHALGDQPLLYFNLRGQDPFRITLVRDGRALAHWDGRVPAAQEVSDALETPPEPVR